MLMSLVRSIAAAITAEPLHSLLTNTGAPLEANEALLVKQKRLAEIM